MLENWIPLRVERRVLAKRRWRGQADDGTDFGFDLEAPLRDGICFHAVEDKKYIINQKPEAVLRVQYESKKEAASLAWQIGNLHFPLNFRTLIYWWKEITRYG